jgi:hypothetical protein
MVVSNICNPALKYVLLAAVTPATLIIPILALADMTDGLTTSVGDPNLQLLKTKFVKVLVVIVGKNTTSPVVCELVVPMLQLLKIAFA